MTTVTFHSIDGTEAALGSTGDHSIVVDRPEGVAGGQGLGFNGGQLLGLAIGGCFANDIRSLAHEMGVKVGRISITVDIRFGGAPRIVESCSMIPVVEMLDGSDPAALIARAKAKSVVRNSVQGGFPVMMD